MASAGAKRTRLSFQKRASAADTLGNKEGDFVQQFELSGKVIALRGSEPVIADRLQGIQPVVITVWKCSKSDLVTTGWRAVDQVTGVSYNIRTVADMRGDGRELDMMAEAGGPIG